MAILVRTPADIERAHDLLVWLVHEAFSGSAPAAWANEVSPCASVLCWMLGHEYNQSFAALLEAVQMKAELAGWTYDPATRSFRRPLDEAAVQ